VVLLTLSTTKTISIRKSGGVGKERESRAPILLLVLKMEKYSQSQKKKETWSIRKRTVIGLNSVIVEPSQLLLTLMEILGSLTIKMRSGSGKLINGLKYKVALVGLQSELTGRCSLSTISNSKMATECGS